MLTLGSLFDGIGGFCLAAERHGIKPIWSSEIDEACQRVTAKHFPNCIQLGDVTKINGAEIPPVDIITFGSPCQDLSIAGKQKGLAGERSGLFLRAIDIIRQMRSATNGRYPSIIVWENVPGAFSSNNGDDFRVVLEEIAETEIPMPEGGKWANCGVVQCDDREICWRVLDAQYWGVAQRRKRIFLVTSFGDKCAKEILLEQEGLRRDSAESECKGEETAANIRKGTNRADRMDRAYTMQLRAGASGGQRCADTRRKERNT